MKTTINDFRFEFQSYGRYSVTFYGKKSAWRTSTTNMPLIDATKNTYEPKRKDLEQLKRLCKEGTKI